MPSNQLEAIMQCGCCGSDCLGCCFCGGYPATNVEYVIDAPNCAALDGATGNISGPDADTEGSCGQCTALVNNLNCHSVPTYVWDDSMPGECIPQPGAEFQFTFILRCDANQPESETDPETTEQCCRNIRLVVMDCNLLSEYRVIPPLSCSCLGENGITAIFDISVLLPDCETFYNGGACDGKPTCTQLGDGPGGTCSLSGATLTITQSC